MSAARRGLAETSGSCKISVGEGVSKERAGMGNDEDKEIREKKAKGGSKEEMRKSS